ncbi:hypothetical protein MTO96_028402 [Rhipicephalus appendiculatus]
MVRLMEYIIFGFLMACNLSLGLYFSFRKTGTSGTTAEVFLGNRLLRTIPLAASSVASLISSTGLVGFPAHYYAYGWHTSWCYVMPLVFVPLSTHVFVPVLYRLRITSIFEGGLRGVVWTDCMQFTIILFAPVAVISKIFIDASAPNSKIQPITRTDVARTALTGTLLLVVLYFIGLFLGVAMTVWFRGCDPTLLGQISSIDQVGI